MSDNATIIREKRDHGYFSASNIPAQDERLSWEARGVLFYLLSKPDDWKVIVKNLQQNCGRDKVYNILSELEKFGYLEKKEQRQNGKFGGVVYTLHEKPLPEKPNTVKSDTDSPNTENPDPYKEPSKQKTEKKQKTDSSSAKSAEEKAPKKRDLLFDAIKEHLLDSHVPNSEIGKVKKALKEKYPHVEDSELADRLLRWIESWKQNYPPEIHLPRATEKVLFHFSKWYDDMGFDLTYKSYIPTKIVRQEDYPS